MHNENLTGLGYMIVRVTTARGAIPLEGAVVMVGNYASELEEGRGDVMAVYKTDRSGVTEKFALPAPSRSLSMSPGNGKSYQTYNLSVSKDGYFTQSYINAPVFDGITSIQSADMIPLPDNGQSDNFDPDANRFFETENPSLETVKKEES
jgi:hypothetical protein